MSSRTRGSGPAAAAGPGAPEPAGENLPAWLPSYAAAMLTAGPPAKSLASPGWARGAPAVLGDNDQVNAVVAGLLWVPFNQRARREVRYALAGALPALGFFAVIVALLVAGVLATVSLVGTFVGLLVLALTLRLARRLGSADRRLAGRLLGAGFDAPPPFEPGRGVLRRLDVRIRDGAGWRSLSYLVLKLPVAVFELYGVFFWFTAAWDLSLPILWPVLGGGSGVAVSSPVPGIGFTATNWPESVLAFILGALTLAAAPWVLRLVVAADRWLIRGLLGPAQLAQRVAELEQSRALAVDDAAAVLRRVERDLHDGAQMRLAALAMGLGMAKDKLATDGGPVDMDRIRELVDAAHRNAKEALVELRDLARGIHPPVLDAGLAEALATLAARSVIPVQLSAGIQDRPTPAIETIAYFCAAELLANVAKHSGASEVAMTLTQSGGQLRLRVSDNGTGGADLTRGSGLPGLVARVRTVDGRLGLTSPPGGPTVVTVELPLQA